MKTDLRIGGEFVKVHNTIFRKDNFLSAYVKPYVRQGDDDDYSVYVQLRGEPAINVFETHKLGRAEDIVSALFEKLIDLLDSTHRSS